MDKPETFSMFVKGLWSGAMFWLPVRHSLSKTPYAYGNQDEALKMLKMCYPDQAYNKEVKVDFTSKGIHK